MRLLIAEDQSMLRDAMATLLLMEDSIDTTWQNPVSTKKNTKISWAWWRSL